MSGGKIFINYRRSDSRADAGRLYDHLDECYPGRVFRDVGSLEPGVEWHEAIAKVLGSADACIVVIGKNWLNATDASGKRRLDDPRDTVRQEIVTALRNGIRVFPVLVGDAEMPAEEELPPDLRPLARRNALEIHEQDWQDNVNKLVGAIERSLGWTREISFASSAPQPGIGVASPPAAGRPAKPTAWPSEPVLREREAIAGELVPQTVRLPMTITVPPARRSAARLLATAIVLLLVGGLVAAAFRLVYVIWPSQQGSQSIAESASSTPIATGETGLAGAEERPAASSTAPQAPSVSRVERPTAPPAPGVSPVQPPPTTTARRPPVEVEAEPAPLSRVQPSTTIARVAEPASPTSLGNQKSQPDRGREPALSPASRAQPSPPARLPENPPVFFRCSGVPEVCGALRAAFDQALEKGSLPSVRNPARAEIVIDAEVSVVEEHIDQQFGTTFVVRTYSVTLRGEGLRSGETVPMPAPSSFSFDARFGRDRLAENAYVLAGSAVEKVRAFWKKRIP